ncbi:FAD binding domain protein [Paraphoma chrysanthemicola]|nr:FAD binding domain protein [Paraphoma chrysanthemicola]
MHPLLRQLFCLSFTSVLVAATYGQCKCIPTEICWPSKSEWDSLNDTVSGALIRGTPPASVCYSTQPNYNEDQCKLVRSQWTNSSWHAQDPISTDYPVWTNNSCNPIYPNGTSVTEDLDAGSRGCSIGSYPAYIINATTAEQVSSGFKWAEKYNIRVVVKSTGHSYTGRSLGYGSLSIWTHNFRGIEVIGSFKAKSCPTNDSQPAVRLAAGHSGLDVLSALADHKLVTVTGANPSVGIIGWLTGGGHGPMTQSYGMGVDNLLEATVVTPNGDILAANAYQNQDLFFAIRGGGGGTYGVVLDAVLKTYPSPNVTLYTLLLASTSQNATFAFWEAIGILNADLQRLKEGGIQGYYAIVGPSTTPTLSFIGNFFLYDRPNGTIEQLMAPIEGALANKASSLISQRNVSSADTFLEGYRTNFKNEDVGRAGSAYGSRLMTPKSLANANATARVFAQIGPSNDANSLNGFFRNPVILGHIVAPSSPPTYHPELVSLNPAWYRTLNHIIVDESWPGYVPRNIIDAIYQSVTWNKTEPLRQLSPDTGAYFNEPDANEPDWQHSFWGENYGKLKKIKDKHDPKGLLWCRKCVGSERFVEDNDGKLCEVRK